MHLNLFIQSRGHHEASWRHPGASMLPLTDIDFYVEAAKRAEAACFDSIFLADSLAVGEDAGHAARTWLEPVTTLGALAMATRHIGLIATASTTYTEPYNLARQFASLDHISSGRIGWNIVTSWSVPAAANYGDAAQVEHSERYARADEFVELTKALWDSWDDDAVHDDRASGLYADVSKIRPVNHTGEHYRVAGPLNLPRCPQGRPVLVQAGASDTGRDFAARHAEAVFTAHLQVETAREYYGDLKRRVAAAGRDPDKVIVLPGFSPVIADTEDNARRYADELNALADVEVGRRRLSGRFGGYDFSHLPLDVPLSMDDFPDTSTVQAARSRTEIIVGIVRKERLTLRQLLARLAGARGHFTCAGTPEQIVGEMLDWCGSGAADGFNLMPPVLPDMLDAFADEVIPLLRRKGVFRERYETQSLRGHLGLARPGD
ncbi:MAG: LLM class flavin-dependent oxidoreductase [Pseudomonadota bacterium]